MVKNLGAAMAVVLALVVGILKGPANKVSLELLDMLDRQLDKLQGGYEHNLNSEYLKGMFAPVDSELPDGAGQEATLVYGALPVDLKGVHLQNGPNPWAPPTKRHHVFDGDGMLRSLRFKDGRAVLHTAWMKTRRLLVEQERGAPYFKRIGELSGLLGLVKIFFLDKGRQVGVPALEEGPANTHFVELSDGRLWALNEGSLPFEFRLAEDGGINSVGYETMQGRLDYPVSAHPKVDSRTGETIFHGYHATGGPAGEGFLHYGRLDSKGELLSYFGVNATGGSFSHDIILTENFAVLIDSSIRFTPDRVLKGTSPFVFKKEHQTLLAVVPRHATSASEVIWVETPQPLAWVHPLHGWEEEEGRVLVLWAPTGFADDKETGVLEGCCSLWYMTELRVDIQKGKVLELKIVDEGAKHSGEFGRIRDDRVGTGFVRYGYTALQGDPSKDFDFAGITKWDMKEKRVVKDILHPAGWIGGEPHFIPSPESSSQGGDSSDDGYLGVYLYSANSTEFALYDARSFANEPVARLRLPFRVPLGFHGGWLSEEHFRKHLALRA